MIALKTRLFAFGIFVVLAGIAPVAQSDTLSLPENAQRHEQVITDPGRYLVPMARWSADGGLYSKPVQGRIVKESWHISGAKSAVQIMAPILAQIEKTHEIILDCSTQDCGGFDFRFAIEVLPAPSIYIDLTAYRFVSARSKDPQGGYLTLLSSTQNGVGYLQIVRAGFAQEAKTDIAKDAPVLEPAIESVTQSNPAIPTDIATRLNQSGRVVLEDLVFKSGSTELGGDRVQSLDEIASYLNTHPDTRIAFVGHTDATGSLKTNQTVSRRRATSAMSYLIDKHGIRRSRLMAEGVGYLAPVARNDTETGREANRRVEAVIISLD